MMNQTALTIQRPTKITLDQIASLLCSSFEGSYWANVDMAYTPTDAEMTDSETYGDWAGFAFYMVNHPDFKLTLTDCEEEETHTLTLDTLKKGIKVMAKKYPRNFNDFINDNLDAHLGDVYLQCSVFGEVIYG
jgi:hypothetical protein